MTRLYVLDLNVLKSGRWRELLPELPQDRRERAQGCRFEDDSIRITGAGWLLQQALERAGVPVESRQITVNPFGKPELTGNGEIHFNLSHSGGWAVCAVGDKPVGVDVELPRCSMAVARRHFCPEELQPLEALSWQEQKIRLNRLWTAKEAFVKAMGRGLTVPLNSFRVRLTENKAELEQTCTDLPYVLHEYVLQPCRMCLCCTDSRPQPEFLAP